MGVGNTSKLVFEGIHTSLRNIMLSQYIIWFLIYLCFSLNKCNSFRFDVTAHCKTEYSIRPEYNHPYPPYHQACWSRMEIIEIVNFLNFTTGVEIGVQRGEFSTSTLSLWTKCKEYHLIDLWLQQSNSLNYTDTANVDNNLQEANYQVTRQAMKLFGEIPRFYRNASTAVAPQFAINSIDFIYIDARHDYCGVLEDIIAWYPILKIGGIMAGPTTSSPHRRRNPIAEVERTGSTVPMER